jgi:hypothetical protein
MGPAVPRASPRPGCPKVSIRLKTRLETGEVPSSVAIACPTIEVGPVSPHPSHRIDRARSPKHLAPVPIDDPSVEIRWGTVRCNQLASLPQFANQSPGSTIEGGQHQARRPQQAAAVALFQQAAPRQRNLRSRRR